MFLKPSYIAPWFILPYTIPFATKNFNFFHLPLKPNTHDDMTKAVYFHVHNIT